MSDLSLIVSDETRALLLAVPERAGGLLEMLKLAGFEGAYAFKTGELVITTPGATEAAVRAALASYDPAKRTAAQEAEAAREEAAQAVAGADLAGLAADVVAAQTLEDVRPALMQALTLMGQMAVAQGLVEPAAQKAAERAAAPILARNGEVSDA